MSIFIYFSVLMLVSSFFLTSFFTPALVLGGAAFAIYCLLGRIKYNEVFLFFSFLFLYLAFFAIVSQYSNVGNVKTATVVLFSVMIGCVLSCQNITFSNAVSWSPLILVFTLFLIKLYLVRDINSIFERNSHNFLSVSLIGGYLSYFLLSKRDESSVFHVFMASLVFFGSAYAGGRSGLICSFLLLVAAVGFYLHQKLDRLQWDVKLFSYSIAGLLLILALFYIVYLSFTLGFLERLIDRGITDYSRSKISISYFQSLSWFNWFFGQDLKVVPGLEKYAFNLHNSYLDLHRSLGGIYLFLYLSILVWTFFRLIRTGRSFFAVCMLALCLRALTDTQIFAGRYDFVVYGTFFMLLTEFGPGSRGSALHVKN